MPVRDKNPFGPSTEEVGKADVGVSDPFESPESVVKCPVCSEKKPEKINTRNTPTQILRICTTCGNQWSCGNVGGAYMIPISPEMRRPQVLEEDDVADDYRLSGTDRWFSDD